MARLGTINLARTFDQRSQISHSQAGTLDYGYTRDAAGQVTGITAPPTPTTTGVTETAAINPANNQISGIFGFKRKRLEFGRKRPSDPSAYAVPHGSRDSQSLL